MARAETRAPTRAPLRALALGVDGAVVGLALRVVVAVIDRGLRRRPPKGVPEMAPPPPQARAG